MDLTPEDRATLFAMRGLIDRLLADPTADETQAQAGLDPQDPRNRVPGDVKLSVRGAECFYRLLDSGLTPHAAGKRMGMSPRASYLRADTYRKIGGLRRPPFDPV